MPAFPTVEGFGADAQGGRGGQVLFVDNANSEGPGSFTQALLTPGPRYILPRYPSGTITLPPRILFVPGQVTIAGQVSPCSVQIKGNQNPDIADGIIFVEGEVIARFLKIRSGGPGAHDSGVGMILYGTKNLIRNAVFQGISNVWGIDAPQQAYGAVDMVSFLDNIIANGADNEGRWNAGSSGNKGDQTNIGGRISIRRCLYANNGSRNPLMQQAALFDFMYNLIYNWGGNNGGQFGEYVLNQGAQGNIINNHYLAGPNSGVPAMVLSNGCNQTTHLRADGNWGWQSPVTGLFGTRVFAQGNWGPLAPMGSSDQYSDIREVDSYYINNGGAYGLPVTPEFKNPVPFDVPPGLVIPTRDVMDYVLSHAGCRIPSVDSVDQSIFTSVRMNVGDISKIGYGGPWPVPASSKPYPKDSNQDGVPDYWAIHEGFSVMEPIAHRISEATGYPIIENYINYKAGDFAGLIVDENIEAPVPPIVIDPTVDPPIEEPENETPVPPVIEPANPALLVFASVLGLLLWRK